MITLYQYLHCPYCIRVRMTLGYLGIPYESLLLPYADEETPIKLTGKKMAPIIKCHDGSFMNESLDIMTYLDQKNILNIKETLMSEKYKILEAFLNTLSKPLFNLLMPYYLNSLEFNDADRIYFQKKKEIKRGPFSKLVERRGEYIQEIQHHLLQIEISLNPFYESKEFSVLDILLASHLWGLYFATEFRVNETLHLYLQKVKQLCHFEYDHDLWKERSLK